MSGWFIFALVASVILIVMALLAPALSIDGDKLFETRKGPIAVWIVVLLVIGGLLFISAATIVPTRSVGVATAFGKPSNKPLSNGFHLVAPWKSVEKLSTATETLNLMGDNKDGNPCVTVRLGNQTTACVDVSVQWNIADAGVVELYRQYRPRGGEENTFHNIETNLVKRQVTDALNVAFSDYDPLASINGTSDTTQPKLHDLAAEAHDLLQTALHAVVKDGVHIRSIIFTVVHYDPTTQDKLNAYAQALADTRIAKQRELTAEATRRANDALAASNASANPAVLYQNCLDLTERLVKEGKTLPPAWSCGAPPTTVVPVTK